MTTRFYAQVPTMMIIHLDAGRTLRAAKSLDVSQFIGGFIAPAKKDRVVQFYGLKQGRYQKLFYGSPTQMTAGYAYSVPFFEGVSKLKAVSKTPARLRIAFR